jgi:hypothetical protein
VEGVPRPTVPGGECGKGQVVPDWCSRRLDVSRCLIESQRQVAQLVGQFAGGTFIGLAGSTDEEAYCGIPRKYAHLDPLRPRPIGVA